MKRPSVCWGGFRQADFPDSPLAGEKTQKVEIAVYVGYVTNICPRASEPWFGGSQQAQDHDRDGHGIRSLLEDLAHQDTRINL